MPSYTYLNIVRALAFVIIATFVSSVHADDMYRPRPGEAYDPSTYCRWNRTGLPESQQNVCNELDRKNGVYESRWQTVEADTGTVYKIDMNSIRYYDTGSAEVVVYIVKGDAYEPSNLKRWFFDCHGHYMDNANFGTTLYAAPRSIAGRIAELACVHAHDSRLEDASRNDQPAPTPTEYCDGFSSEECDRIRRAAEAKAPPSFCKAGYGLAESGLTSEQIRICDVTSAND